MSRCKSCNVILSPAELKRVNEITNEPEDLCGSCGYIAFLDINDLFMEYRDYQFGEFTEGPESFLGMEPQVRVGMSEYS
jgi:hypothetical protein